MESEHKLTAIIVVAVVIGVMSLIGGCLGGWAYDTHCYTSQGYIQVQAQGSQMRLWQKEDR